MIREVIETGEGYAYYRFTDLQEARMRALASAQARLPYVHDTWVARTPEERLNNILIGYVAQEVLEQVFRQALLPFISYDETRIDDSRNDDPFDFIVLPPEFVGVEALVAQLREHFYSLINSQGRFRRPDLIAFREFVHGAGGYICDLKSSVDNRRHGIDNIIHKQHHIAYAEQKNDSGFVVESGIEYLEERGQEFEQYVLRKQAIKDVHFRVFFEDAALEAAYYVGFISGRELVEDGEVGPFPGTPWVRYHRVVISEAYPPGAEREVMFSNS